jgi:uncharacterized protein (DUF58 family)
VIPTTRTFGAAFLYAILLWYAATSEVQWLFLLALWLMALLLAAFVYAAWNRSGVTLWLSVRESRPGPGSPALELPDVVLRRSPFQAPLFEGDGIDLEIEFRARRGPRGPVWASGEVGQRRFAAGTGIVTNQGWSRLRRARAVTRGVMLSKGWSLGTSDPFGFFQGFRKAADGEVALVLPKFTSLAGRSETREVEASVAAPRAGSGNELFGIREYRPGDSLRRIHWRSSARHGELVVREYEPPGVQTLRILVDPTPSSTEVADQIARIAASEAWDCLRAGGRVDLGPLQTRDIWDVLEWLARYPYGPGDTDDLARPDIVVTANPDLLETLARRNWLVGDAPAQTEIAFERVGTQWPL